MEELPGHPAVYSEAILDFVATIVPDDVGLILDVFAGIGKVADLRLRGVNARFVGIELQPKWAVQGQSRGCQMFVCNALELPFRSNTIPMVFSSPAYGNRMGDHHNAQDESDRITYTHKYGEPLHPDNTGRMFFWQPKYKQLHTAVGINIYSVLKPGHWCIWNTKDFYRTIDGAIVYYAVTEWFIQMFRQVGFEFLDRIQVPCRGMRWGANREKRVPYEDVCVFRKPGRS